MFTDDFSKAPKFAQGTHMFYGGSNYTGLRALIQLYFTWRRVVRRMKASPGYMGHFVWYKFPLGIGNFSIWDSYDNMMRFAQSSEHRKAVAWLVKPGTANGAFIRFCEIGAEGHSIGGWRAEADGEAWRIPRMPFSSGLRPPSEEIEAS